MAASALLFGDFTKDEVALLLTENQKGFEFICQGRKGGVSRKKKTEISGVSGTTATKNETSCVSESAPTGAVVSSAGGPSPPPRESGDQSKNPSRLNANAPAFVPGRADYGASDKDSQSLVPNSPPAEQRETNNPIGQGPPSTPPSDTLSPSNTASTITDASLVNTTSQPTVGQCSQPVVAVQPQTPATTATHSSGRNDTHPAPTTPSSSVGQVPADCPNSREAISVAPPPAANSVAKDTTVSAACVRTARPSVQKSWAAIVVSKGPAVPSAGTSSPVCASSGGVATSMQGTKVCSSNSSRAPKGRGVACPVENNGVVGNGVVNTTSAQAQLSSLGEQLQQILISYDAPAIVPRGLTNVGNWCYVHAPLQALLALPGFHQLLRTLNPYPALTRGCSATPITDSMIQFFHEFAPSPKIADNIEGDVHKTKRTTSKGDLVRGDSFKPDCIYQMLQEIKSNFSFKGRQEDAEEFLGCLLDGLHEEMVVARQAAAGSEAGNKVWAEADVTRDNGDEWEHVGPKNRSSILRKALLKDSPIREIFGGQLYCSVHRQGTKESVIVEPFFSLQLDIQSDEVRSVQQALDSLVMREVVHMNAGSETEVEAHRKTSLASLPSVLVLHLKRFLYSASGGGLQKLMKQVEYSVDLEISKDLLAPTTRPKVSATQRSYKLWAVVYHHGNTASGGHYTCDAYHPSSGGWLHTDDGNLKLVTEDQVLFKSQGGNKVAYLLFYIRSDLLKTRQ